MTTTMNNYFLGICMLLALSSPAKAADDQEEAIANLNRSNLFLAENRGNEGVTETSTGLQYRVIAHGSGCRPAPDSTVRLHYQMSLIGSNAVVDDSRNAGEEPASFDLKQMIPAWEQAIPLMREGDTWELYVPPSLGYGAAGSPPLHSAEHCDGLPNRLGGCNAVCGA
ncbi:FKBP-type peptidyl-prolyl cis-trans isomerase [Lysobacter niastensis]|uniref:Peptidyl-prolyl cis-trans isomerase n=1 Tax=Lysobacter niastensis TaxID=380629 RepID=A0ABS0B8A8_9GAMM|nr:FKBP-type peptidyl-prolyl cis-trans isomerase [Lysobacter niastensis]MBF6023962.1 FKBP-type peptidyl-prolyl cis-trans isomerase [Lysobacter niastensis]